MAELVVYLKDRELSRHTIRSASVRVGRDPESDLVIDNVGVSRHHATVFFDGTHFHIKDEGSQNGVFINGARVTSQVIQETDQILLGKFSLRIEGASDGVGRVIPQRSVALAAPRLRDPQKTMALGAADVARLIQQQVNETSLGSAASSPDGTGRTLLIGFAAILALGIAGYFGLLR